MYLSINYMSYNLISLKKWLMFQPRILFSGNLIHVSVWFVNISSSQWKTIYYIRTNNYNNLPFKNTSRDFASIRAWTFSAEPVNQKKMRIKGKSKQYNLKYNKYRFWIIPPNSQSSNCIGNININFRLEIVGKPYLLPDSLTVQLTPQQSQSQYHLA